MSGVHVCRVWYAGVLDLEAAEAESGAARVRFGSRAVMNIMKAANARNSGIMSTSGERGRGREGV